MGQNIQYLYEYENGRRVRNLGFMKIEKQMDKCVIQIYAKDIDEVKGIIFQTPGNRKYIGGWEADLYEIEESKAVTPEQEGDRIPQVEEIMEEPQMESPIKEEPMMEAEEYVPTRNVTIEKIQRQDLSRLPRKDWRIANNSFLLHGFYNYHHLLYIEDEGEVWIGVPGIFHEKEKLAANTFGFTKFRRIADVDVELSEKEMNTYEDFGYWCRQILIPKV